MEKTYNKPSKYRVNIRIGVKFNDYLKQHEYFQKYPVLIVPSFLLLDEMTRYQQMNEGKPFEMSSRLIKKHFGGYFTRIRNQINLPLCGNHCDDLKYTKVIDFLKELGLMNQIRSYQKGDGKRLGHCMKYMVTDKGRELVGSSNMEYFKKLHTDKDEMRNESQNISRRLERISADNDYLYSDLFRQETQDILINLKFDYDEVSKQIDKDKESFRQENLKYGIIDETNGDRKINSIISNLTDIRRKTFNVLKHNKTDNRVWNQVIGLKSSYRPLLYLDEYRYTHEIDQRACHPSFLGLFCKESFESGKHDWSDVDETLLRQEILRYSELFNGIDDPRETISKDTNLAKPLVKRGLNTWINGGRRVELDECNLEGKPKFDHRIVPLIKDWYHIHYPQMSRVLEKTIPSKKIGTFISANFETKIFQDSGLYELGKSLGFRIIYQYDGLGIFSRNDETDVSGKIDTLRNYIKEKSNELFGFPIVTTVKEITQ